MKHKNMYAYAFFAAAMITSNSTWTMDEDEQPKIEVLDGEGGKIVRQEHGQGQASQLVILSGDGARAGRSVDQEVELQKRLADVDKQAAVEAAAATVDAVLAQNKATGENMDELKRGVNHKTELQVYAELARQREFGKQDPWHTERDFATKAGQTFVLHTAKSSGENIGKRTVDALYDRFDPIAQAQRRVAITQAEQGEMVSIASATQLKMQQFTDEEYTALVLLNNPQLAQRYEKHHFSTPRDLEQEQIKKLHPNFDAKNSEEQSAIRELIEKQIENDKQEIDAQIARLVARAKHADAVQKVRNKMAVNQRIQEVHNTITRQAKA
jgi:hypothetical protein